MMNVHWAPTPKIPGIVFPEVKETRFFDADTHAL